ncbi:MAG: GNAT family N-acetyltransferase [Chloroflexi bacterium]|nr:GNAT family N-acetyltransferase [Chloroflexota bacterium]
MSAGALSSSQTQPEAGLRRINIQTDLGRVADLMELAFGPTLDANGRQMLREMRLLSRSGPLLWLIGRLDRAVQGWMGGYVWIEPDNSQLIGNVSVYPAGFDNMWIIANVAVHPSFRRQGIALQLVEKAMLNSRDHGARMVQLQVDATNYGARKLYEQLGFKELRTFTRWRRRPYIPPPRPLAEMPYISFRGRGEWKDQYELARQLRPNEKGGMRWLTPTNKRFFRPSWWRSLFNVDNTLHWVMRDADEQLAATLCVEVRFGMTYAMCDLLVAPHQQGALEKPFLNYMIRYLHDRGKGLFLQHPQDDHHAQAIFKEYEFEATHSLVHMEWKC